ncbi:MAG: type II and III secretion system protein family protein [Pseudomonadota bacterium]|uniref:type II and III secretion system protein family protein n=1 Tax=Phenylobacterium sp. TaxID=1871053 RepID=UPI0025CBD427|nr:type II and III secretion system protein family protein [Phenylobacterium sp.]MBT9473286.1 type II and III secretion system protein family protein [Phenylobacterium sp.]
MNPRRILIALAALGAALLPPAAASAQSQTSSPAMAAGLAAQSAVVRVDLSGGAASQSLTLPNGKSAIIELPVDVRDVLVTNPGVADAMLRSPRRIFILGLKNGSTDAVFFDTAGRRILTLDIRVDQDPSSVAQTINRIVPGSKVRVDAMNESLILSGQVANLADADKAVQIARAAVAKPEMVLNMLSIAGKDQVMLKVRIVEMQRNVIKQLGFNLNAVLGQLGEPQYLLGTAASFGVNGSLLGGITSGYQANTTKQPVLQFPCDKNFPQGRLCDLVVRDSSAAENWDTATIKDTAGSPGLNKAEATIKAFERVGLVRTLAEPNLTAVSGESAKFLAGGEFPIPVAQDKDGAVTIEFKPFGVGLGFTPVVLSSGRIAIKVSTEVSELTSQGAFSLATPGASAALTIPALTVRRAETSVELPSGGAMMIAGLLQEKTKQNIDALPGMTTLPVLGTLFRSRDYLAGETELVIIVTPYIVGPTTPDRLQTPVDGLRIADDASTLLMGALTKAYNANPQAPSGRSYQGPYGYVIE